MNLEVIREARSADLAEVSDLLDAARAHDGHEPLGEHKWLDLVHGGRRGYAGVIAREEGHAHPVGYAHLSAHKEDGPGHWGLEIVVHPQHRGVGVEAALVSEALRVAAEEGGGHLHLWVFRPTEMHEALAHRFGLRKGRDLLHMRVGLPVSETADLPGGVRLRPFRPGHDEEGWVELNNRAFAHHPEQGAWDRATLERRMSESWFDPEGLLLAEDDEGLAGFCWVKAEPGGEDGEIYVIGVDPRKQGSGLGRSLVVAGLEWMAERGLRRGKLYVDASNEAAVALYRQLGFEEHHLDRAYVTDVPAA